MKVEEILLWAAGTCGWPAMGRRGSTSREPSSRANRSVLCSELGAGLRWHLLPSVQAVLCSVSQSCPTLCDPMDYRPPRRLCPWGSLGKNTGVGCHALLQGIFSTQGSNPGLLHCRWNLHRLSHQFRQLPAFLASSPQPRGNRAGVFHPTNWQQEDWDLLRASLSSPRPRCPCSLVLGGWYWGVLSLYCISHNSVAWVSNISLNWSQLCCISLITWKWNLFFWILELTTTFPSFICDHRLISVAVWVGEWGGYTSGFHVTPELWTAPFFL